MTNSLLHTGLQPDPGSHAPPSARAAVELDNADEVVSAICDHMVEHGAVIERNSNCWSFRFPNALATFTNEGRVTSVEVSADDLEGLYYIRLSVASHLMEFGPANLELEWKGHGDTLVRPPNFQKFTVESIRQITPRTRRITFSAEDVSKFISMDALHLNLILQENTSDDPQWPTVGANGLIAWDETKPRPSMRKYTVRSLDIDQGTLDIDFVLHADSGPGSKFAEDAVVSDVVGALGPGGGGLVEADRYFFAGDETALPAIARMLEQLSETASATVIIEVSDKLEIQNLCSRARLETSWILREDGALGNSLEFVRLVTNIDIPDDDRRTYLWVGCEFQSAQTIRKALRSSPRIAKKDQLVVSYWRSGHADDG
ncbi:DUF2218 domain-containing protein [Agrobacterium burrii]|uniref:Siderophore-interacting protein n=1 Tax=Agrobacterium burrii TaxID=2815339 RepID=A0ABS3EJA4_9HYPH|nr:siderophore-interacting protein [Agrobacterium burrii]